MNVNSAVAGEQSEAPLKKPEKRKTCFSGYSFTQDWNATELVLGGGVVFISGFFSDVITDRISSGNCNVPPSS